MLPTHKCVEGTVVRYHLDAARDAEVVDVYIPVVEYKVDGQLHSIKLRGSTDKPGATGQKHQLAVDPTQPSNAKLIPDPVAEQENNRQFAMVTALIGTALCIAGGMGWIN